MTRFSKLVVSIGLVVILTPALAGAQQSDSAGSATPLQVNQGSRGGAFDVRSSLTQDQFEAFAAAIGPLLRFRQVGDATTLGSGRVEIGVQAANMPFDASKGVWTTAHRLERSISYPQVVARFGASDRVDVGAWGGLDPGAKYGLAGFDTRIALLRQSDGRPVSVLIRPSIAALIYPSEVLVGTLSVDVSVSRAFGPWSPYGGIAGSTSGAVERSKVVDLDPATSNHSVAFAGLSYRWRALTVSAEMEKGAGFNYAFRVGRRF